MIKISEAFEEFFNKIFPKLKDELKAAQMHNTLANFVVKCLVLALIFSLIFSITAFFILSKSKLLVLLAPILIFFLFTMFFVFLRIPKYNIRRVRNDIENDIFVPSRMLLTLLESGNSIISALVDVSYTKAKSSKYFGNIASEIFLGKNIEQAIDDAIRYTPSESFRRVLEPIKKSLKTGTDIQRNLLVTLQEMSQEKIIEIEDYEKKLSPLSMFYMIFGTIIPVLSVVGIVVFVSIIGLKAEFFPFFLILLLVILIIQYIFVVLYRSIRPLVKL